MQYTLCELYVMLFVKVLDQLKKEHELTKQMISTLSSFRVDPAVATGAGGDRYSKKKEDERKKEDEHAKRDPDVWPPPTPQEPR